MVLYDGDPAAIPACPADHPTKAYEGNGDLIPEPTGCAACSCAAPTINCQTKLLAFQNDDVCTMPGTPVAQPTPNNCLAASPSGGPKAVIADAPTATVGACAPSGGSKIATPPHFQRAGLVCGGGGLGLGCGAGKSCTGRAAPPFVAGLCVWRSGDQPCPSSYPDKHSFTDSVVDTRDCTSCVCGAATASCTATSHVFSNSMCNGAAIDVPNDGSCVAINGNVGSISIDLKTDGSCPASGGQPVGTIVAGALSTTVCCAP